MEGECTSIYAEGESNVKGELPLPLALVLARNDYDFTRARNTEPSEEKVGFLPIALFRFICNAGVELATPASLGYKYLSF